jgi:hypothetical protein
MKPGSNSVEDHPQRSHDGHPVDGAVVGAGSLWAHSRGIFTPSDSSLCSQTTLVLQYPDSCIFRTGSLVHPY